MIRKNKRYYVYYMLPGNEKLKLWTFSGWDVGFERIIQVIRDYQAYNQQNIIPCASDYLESEKLTNVLLQIRTLEDFKEVFPRILITEDEYLT